MKFSEVIRRSCCTGVLALLCVASSAVAQNPRIGLASMVSVPRLASVITLPIAEKTDKKKKVDAPEGGSAAAYLIMAGLTCVGGILIASRKQSKASL